MRMEKNHFGDHDDVTNITYEQSLVMEVNAYDVFMRKINKKCLEGICLNGEVGVGTIDILMNEVPLRDFCR